MKISEATYCVVDIETTGLDPATDRIVEIACVATTATEVVGMWASLVDGRPCNAETSAIHGLTDDDLIRAPLLPDALKSFWTFVGRFDGETNADNAVLAAHNAAFDKSFVAAKGIPPWLCTKRLAQKLYPSAPSSKNQVLRYWLTLNVDTFGVLPHRALADCLVTAALLRDELGFLPAVREDRNLDPVETVEQLIAYADAPLLLANWPKGKFYGKPIGAADTGYIQWALGPKGMVDMDSDLRFTLETYIKEIRA
jgi:exodeoxyribonuclease X